MMKKIFFSCFFFLSLVFFSFHTFAQMAYYGSLGLRRIYQSTLINPVLTPDPTVIKHSMSFVPFLPLSPFDTGFNITSSSLNLGSMLSMMQSDTFGVDDVLNGMNNSKKADIFLGANISLLHLYLSVGNQGSHIEISQRLKMTFNTSFINKNNLKSLLNESAMYRTLDLSSSRMKAMAWNELAFGYTRPIDEEWTIGGRVKYLTGILYADFNANPLVARSDNNGNSVDMDARIRTASLNPILDNFLGYDLTPYKSDKPESLIINGLTKNFGLAVDAGVSYKYDDELTLFGGVNDLGFIRWSNNPLTYAANGTIPNFYILKKDPITGTLITDWQIASANFNQGDFKTSALFTALNAQFNAGATWQPRGKKWFHADAITNLYLVNGGLRYPDITVSGTVNGGRWAEFTMNTSYSTMGYFRIGSGFSAKVGILQMHLFSNNILAAFNLSDAHAADLQFGLSWAWRDSDDKQFRYRVSGKKMCY